MIRIGNKIMATKEIGDISKGEVFNVTDIREGGIIVFENESLGYGVMTYSEFVDRFKVIDFGSKDNILRQKRVWSEWENDCVIACPYGRDYIFVHYEIRNNGRIVQVRAKYKKTTYHTSATCCLYDSFDLEKGKTIAVNRLLAKIYSRIANDIAEEY